MTVAGNTPTFHTTKERKNIKHSQHVLNVHRQQWSITLILFRKIRSATVPAIYLWLLADFANRVGLPFGEARGIFRGERRGPWRHIKWPDVSLTVSYSIPNWAGHRPEERAFLAASSLCLPLLFLREPINYCQGERECVQSAQQHWEVGLFRADATGFTIFACAAMLLFIRENNASIYVYITFFVSPSHD